MKLYLDTGNIDEIKEVAKQGLLDGVTTNPSLIAKEGKDAKSIIREIAKILNKECDDYRLSFEVIKTSSSDLIIDEAREIAKLDKNIVVKIPLTIEGLKAVKVLSAEGIRCNVTLCFSANQALLAAKAGAWCVSPFVGRVDDEGYEGIKLIEDIRIIFNNYKFDTKILAASIRGANDVLECAKIGSDIATIPYKIFQKLYYNPLTDIGLEQFDKDYSELQKKLKGSKK